MVDLVKGVAKALGRFLLFFFAAYGAMFFLYGLTR